MCYYNKYRVFRLNNYILFDCSDFGGVTKTATLILFSMREEFSLGKYSIENIRNVAITGHAGKGKTTLAEAMLFVSGATERLGRVADGNTVLDFDSEEKRRKVSISSSMAYTEWRNRKINIFDTPGLFDFEGGRSEAMRACETTIVVFSAGKGIDVGAEKALSAAGKMNKSKIIAVSKSTG